MEVILLSSNRTFMELKYRSEDAGVYESMF